MKTANLPFTVKNAVVSKMSPNQGWSFQQEMWQKALHVSIIYHNHTLQKKTYLGKNIGKYVSKKYLISM